MKLQYKQGQNIIFIDTSANFSSQPVSTSKQSLIETYAEHLKENLFAATPLEAAPTGATFFCLSKERAREVSAQLKGQKIQYKFLFVTDRISQQLEIKLENKFDLKLNLKNIPASSTLFRRIKRSPFFELWEAHAPSGQSQSISAQAAEIGLAILGDIDNGGTPFPHFCLHTAELSIPGEQIWICPPPRIFERLGVLRDREIVNWLMSLDSRQRLFNFLQTPQQTLRLSHDEIDGLRWDALGQVLWGSWYRDQDPTPLDLCRFDFVATIVGKKFRVRKMLNRGQDPLSRIDWTSENTPDSWTAEEGVMKFSFHSQRGLSPGLFLDQRNNRHFVFENAKGLKVLNLFSYTCGFSVAAALGQAKEVVSVDVSREFLDWGKENFLLNNLVPDQYEFFKQDSILFLKGAAKRGRQFDLVICDPPSFARNKDSIFSLEKNLEDLLELCANVLSPAGRLLFSCNYEKWTLSDLTKRVQRQGLFKLLPTPSPTLDYEKPGQPRLLKTLVLGYFL